jgi:hypothetical protein
VPLHTVPTESGQLLFEDMLWAMYSEALQASQHPLVPAAHETWGPGQKGQSPVPLKQQQECSVVAHLTCHTR